MADVFISYSSLDRPVAQSLAEALQAKGFSVWWDRKIPVGEAFDEEIESELEQARCVVVLWSPNSVKSKWVKDEAAEGLAKRTLLPALIAETKLPFGYRRVQTADLRQWQPGSAHAGFDQLLADVARLLGALRDASAQQGASPPQPPGWFKSQWRASAGFRIVVLALPALAIAAGALATMLWPIPTRVQLDLTVDRVTFTVAGEGKTPILDTVGFSALTVEKFAVISFAPQTLAVADPTRMTGAEPVPADAWKPLAGAARAAFVALHDALRPALTLQASAAANQPIGKLDLLLVRPGAQITFERRQDRPSVQLNIEGQQLTPLVMTNAELEIVANHAPAKNLGPLPFQADSLLFKARLKEASPEVLIESQPASLALKVRLVGETPVDLLPKGGTRVSRLGLIKMTTADTWESTVIAPGTLRYPDYPNQQPIAIAPSDFVGLDRLDPFSITALTFDPKAAGLRLTLDGTARHVAIRSGEFTRDGRLSRFEALRASSHLAVLGTIFVAVLSATWSAFHAYREVHV